MCGIVGVINLNGKVFDEKTIKPMMDSLAHRGPDGEGFFVENNIGLGHRRLAVIDLSEAAAQPLFSTDERYVISYNGELYNFKDLREELESAGFVFQSNSDTEVVLNAFIHWGKECLNLFNGMFAFVIYDRREKKLFIARDRYGIKPLYYAFQNNLFLFSSEHKAFLKHPEFKNEIDLEGLYEYFTFQNFFTSKTLLKDVKLFPQGNFAFYDVASGTDRLILNEYWDFEFCEPENHLDEKEYLEELIRLFEQAVQRQLVSDVDVGSYLSGGIDSGSLTAVAADRLPYMKTFTCGFDLNSASGLELGFDERVKAEYMSYLYRTEHYEMVLKAGDMERILPKLAWHLEEPRVGQSYPNMYAAQLASKFVKVCLSGTGGDELFGGYPWRYYRAAVNIDFENYIDKYYTYWHRLIPNKTLRKVFSPIQEEVKHVWTRDIFRDTFHTHAEKLVTPENYVNHSMYLEAKTFLHGLLVVEDKLSMAHSLETRVPFLDNDLVEFAMKCPVHLKLKNLDRIVKINENEPGSKTRKYFNKTRDGKLIFRKAMNRYMPKDIANGIKQGFSAPDASWFKGESIEYVKKKLLKNDARIFDYMDREEVGNLLNEHFSGKQNRRLFIWSLLNFEEWCGLYLDK